jgi:D-sedoheptulose 7-phosphate isomerase
VIRAIEYANEHEAVTVGLCGYSGGRLKEKARHSVHVNVNDMQKVEDVHLILGHLAMQILAGEE